KEYNDYYYQVLTRPPWADYTLEWKGKYYWGNIPSGAVSGGPGIYVGRYRRRRRYYVPGKVVPKHWAMFYGYNGKEYHVNRRYEVLVKKDRKISHYDLTNVKYDFTKA
ncbi:DM9 repeat-containing protein, partial [Salmonella sp. s51884]|uniref:DM9 repeat-containing protein n=1 Tax=Salmonella sp. s51884 TaxID=3159654 RepID=UPI00397EAAF0